MDYRSWGLTTATRFLATDLSLTRASVYTPKVHPAVRPALLRGYKYTTDSLGIIRGIRVTPPRSQRIPQAANHLAAPIERVDIAHGRRDISRAR